MLNRRSVYNFRPEDFALDSAEGRSAGPVLSQPTRDFGLGAAEIIESRASSPCPVGFGRNVRRAHVGPG